MPDAPPLRHTLLLVRHGEIGLKSVAVRARLERLLTKRLEEGLLRSRVEAVVRHTHARHFVEATDLDAAAAVVARTFGITTYSPAVMVRGDLDDICTAAARYAESYWPQGVTRFAVRPRRTGSHPFTSQDIGIKAGSAVYKAMQAKGVKVKVDLTDPEFALNIEVRGKDVYLFHDKRPGPGGLPLGSQGRMVVLLDSGDAAAAAYLMMRRGAMVYPYYVPQIIGTQHRKDAPPRHEPDTEHPAVRLHEALLAWGAPTRLDRRYLSEEEVAKVTGEPLPDDGVALIRIMLDQGMRLAHHAKAQAIVTGETVRAPWARRLPETHLESQIPVLRPLMGLARPLIDDFRELLGLARLGGPRAPGTERAYTAGGRLDAQSTEEPRKEVGGWDPW